MSMRGVRHSYRYKFVHRRHFSPMQLYTILAALLAAGEATVTITVCKAVPESTTLGTKESSKVHVGNEDHESLTKGNPTETSSGYNSTSSSVTVGNATTTSVASSHPNATSTTSSATPSSTKVQSQFDYSSTKVRGVNLGSWFVLEPYMVPSLFGPNSTDSPVDEYTLTEKLGKEQAQQVLEEHWKTWIVEDDFKQIAAWGFNTVRIPIGYWAFLAREQDPYVQGQTKYLDLALQWARNNGLYVWIDVHGVPGSQNGYDNSGLRDHEDWFSVSGNYEDSVKAFSVLAEAYGGPEWSDVISGIELVNEPRTIDAIIGLDNVNRYYEEVFPLVRDQGNTTVVIHDGYQPFGAYNDFAKSHENSVVTHHPYQVFDVYSLQLTIDEHVSAVCETGRSALGAESEIHRVFSEWSAALTDCAPLLNGMGRGARYDNTFSGSNTYIGNCGDFTDFSTWTDELKQNTRRYVEAQLDAYDYGGQGWIFWAYKTENQIDWDVSRLIDYGLFPQPLTDRQYPNQCGF